MSGIAQSQSWPSKPVRVILSNSPGSSPDMVVRLVAERLTKAPGQSFIVDNRPGGEGVTGAELTAKSAPDG